MAAENKIKSQLEQRRNQNIATRDAQREQRNQDYVDKVRHMKTAEEMKNKDRPARESLRIVRAYPWRGFPSKNHRKTQTSKTMQTKYIERFFKVVVAKMIQHVSLDDSRMCPMNLF